MNSYKTIVFLVKKLYNMLICDIIWKNERNVYYMKEDEKEYSIIVDDVYKTFNVYLDKANTIKEKLLFLFSRNKKEK